MSATNPLSADALLQAMAAALPRPANQRPNLATHTGPESHADAEAETETATETHLGTTASPASTATAPDISTPYEALGLFVHACMTQLGFRLRGFDEDHLLAPDQLPPPPQLPRARDQGDVSGAWNASPTALSFVYAHAQSALTFVVRVDRMGAKAEIRGLATGAERIQRIELAVADYVATSELPWRLASSATPSATAEQPGGAEPRLSKVSSSTADRLARLFFARDRLAQLAARFQTDIVQKLLPGLHKQGYEEADSASADSADVRADLDRAGRLGAGRPPGTAAYPPHYPPPIQPPINPYQPNPLLDPLAIPRRPAPVGDFPPPGFDDEYEIGRGGGRGPLGGAGGGAGALGPFGIGHDDLYPPGLGPHDPLRPSLGGGLGGGLRGGPGGVGGGGMHATFVDYLFGRSPGSEGRGAEFDPQIPPGARFDDPSGGMGGLGPRFGGGRRPGGGGSGGFYGSGGGGGDFGGFGGGII